jgi:dolichyl-diphosphooligosaccharide--protein glycosyltransferase
LDEDRAIRLLRKFDIDYVFITFGGASGMPSDDLNKLMWMVRLGSETNPKLRETDYLSSSGEFKVDTNAPTALRKSLLYKLSYYKFGERLGEGL